MSCFSMSVSLSDGKKLVSRHMGADWVRMKKLVHYSSHWLTAVRICGRRTCRTRGKRRDFRHCLRDPCPKLIHSQVDWKVPRWLMLD